MRGIVATLTCLAWAPHAAADNYLYSTVDVPGAVRTEALGVNAVGTIVGKYVDANDIHHAFVLQDGIFLTIDVPGASATLAARGINARGDIVGNFLDDSGNRHGFAWSDGRFAQIDFPDSVDMIVEEINNAGYITGQWSDADSGDASGFILKDGKFFDVSIPGAAAEHVLAAQDDGLVLVGRAEIGGGTWGFIGRESGEYEIVGFPGLSVPCTALRYINQPGDIVGGFAVIGPDDICFPPFGEAHGFVLRNGEFILFDIPGATVTEPMGINDGGVIVGRYTDEDGATHGFRAEPKWQSGLLGGGSGPPVPE